MSFETHCMSTQSLFGETSMLGHESVYYYYYYYYTGPRWAPLTISVWWRGRSRYGIIVAEMSAGICRQSLISSISQRWLRPSRTKSHQNENPSERQPVRKKAQQNEKPSFEPVYNRLCVETVFVASVNVIHWRQPRRGCRGHIPQYFGWGTSTGISPNISTYFRI